MSSQTAVTGPTVSFEFFPPKSLSAERGLMTCAHALRRFKPAFQTVTLGAGQQASDGNVEGLAAGGLDGEGAWPVRLRDLTEVSTAAHIPLSRFATEHALFEHLDALWHQRIYRLVLIRGDGGANLPSGMLSVAEAVRAITQRWSFDISVSAYPEMHPKAVSRDSDLAVLKAKQDAGAARSITQFFFNNEDFYRFRDAADRAGVRMPVVPGVMPIHGYKRIARFSDMCGATFSADLVAAFSACDGDRHQESALARQILEDQVTDLARNGVEHMHLYTLNRSDLSADACRAFEAAQAAVPPVRLALAG